MIPKELIPYFIKNANASSPFNSMKSSHTSTNLRSNFPELFFPAPLNYNYQIGSWESMYDNQLARRQIPWHRQKGSSPVHPILNDSITLLVDKIARTITVSPYSSNECSVLPSFENDKNHQCVFAHFWCRKNDSISYQGNASFDESIKKCQGKVSLRR